MEDISGGPIEFRGEVIGRDGGRDDEGDWSCRTAIDGTWFVVGQPAYSRAQLGDLLGILHYPRSEVVVEVKVYGSPREKSVPTDLTGRTRSPQGDA